MRDEVGKSGSYTFSLPMPSNDVVLVTLEQIKVNVTH
jgi:hypothetical protein